MIDAYTPVTVDVATKLPDRVDAVVLLAVGDTPEVATAFDGPLNADQRRAMEAMLAAGTMRGKPKELAAQAIGGKPASRLITVGVGKRAEMTLQTLREAAGTLAKAARQHRLARVAVVIDPQLPPPTHEVAEALATGLCTGFFKLGEFKGVSADKNDAAARLHATLVVDAPAARFSAPAVARAVTVATAQNFARAVAARPGNVMHPPALADLSQRVARACGLTCRVLDEKQIRRLGMGGLLAVGMGSGPTPPRLIVLEWKGRFGAGKAKGGKRGARDSDAAPLLLVGKAITFDTGGISIKPREGMQRMVYDKCGAMAVLGTMIAVARLGLPTRVVGILAAAENHVSATAYRPGDILTLYNGLTVEVTNTDAEGRLVLGDALAWGIEQYRPAAVVDLATLTGGVVVALGKEFAGVMGTDDALAAELRRCGEAAGEKIWPLPLGEEVRELMKSDHADVVNSGGRYAHPLQGGEFLRRCIPGDGKGVPWAHLDIAGVADSEKGTPMYAPGATGWGVRTLVQWIGGRASRGGGGGGADSP